MYIMNVNKEANLCLNRQANKQFDYINSLRSRRNQGGEGGARKSERKKGDWGEPSPPFLCPLFLASRRNRGGDANYLIA